MGATDDDLMAENAAFTALYERLNTLKKDKLIGLIIESLTPAGALSEWGSSTIESVLSPWEDALEGIGVPWIGDTGNNEEGHAYWGRIANELGIETDYEEPDPFDLILDQVREHRGDYVGQVETMIDEIREHRELVETLTPDIKAALEGNSNDAEHDALVFVAQALGIEYKDPDDD